MSDIDILVMYLLYTMYLSSNTTNMNKTINSLYYSFSLFVVTLQIEWKHIYNTHTTTFTISTIVVIITILTYIHNILHSYRYIFNTLSLICDTLHPSREGISVADLNPLKNLINNHNFIDYNRCQGLIIAISFNMINLLNYIISFYYLAEYGVLRGRGLEVSIYTYIRNTQGKYNVV